MKFGCMHIVIMDVIVPLKAGALLICAWVKVFRINPEFKDSLIRHMGQH